MFFGGGRGGGFDPFEGMGGGFPGGPPGRKRGPVDNQKYYKLLQVEQNATEAEIKKAYRKMAIKHHPDKGGDPETFKSITTAYEVLSDPEKRARYNEGGEDAVSGEGGGNPTDVFDMFFGGGGGGRGGGGRRQRKKTKDVVHTLPVTLEQLYNGATKKMAVTREVLDQKAGVKDCAECDGRGVQVRVVRMGPMIQQMQQPCGTCNGVGKMYQTKKEREVLEIFVEKGAVDGHKITFSGKADEHPDADPGDVVFTLKQKEHPTFIRRGADLYVKKDISLREALCGFTLEIDHLDGRKLLIKNSPGEIVTPLLKDPLATEDTALDFDVFTDTDSPGEVVAQADTQDVNACKKVCEKKNFKAFVLSDGSATFKNCSREEALAAKKPKKGATLYVVKDPNESASHRMCKAVKGEGMPTHKNPFVFGNMFLLLNIVFPDNMDEACAKQIMKALPGPALNVPTVKETDENVEVHYVVDKDPVVSLKENMGGDHRSAYDDDEEGGAEMGGQRVQCAQQ
jgi:DnaJ family protein A protein 2